MKIGFYIQWNKNSLNSTKNVLGDELFGESLCKVLRKIKGVKQVELYAPNYKPKEKLDVMIYLNDNEIIKNFAHKHILYWQNGFGGNADEKLTSLYSRNYDAYIFFSYKLLKIHQKKGYNGLYLPFGVDLEFFFPREKEDRFEFDVAYVGNDIKGKDATMKYLYPAIEYNFGLFGNWRISKFKIWDNLKKRAPYRKKFEKISKGKIPQEDVPKLYSSAKINLNCTLQSCIDWNVITLRTYEILACKGFLITDIVPIAKEQMEGCMVFTTGGKDLKEKINYYLNNPSEREKIANRGYEYVIENASIEACAKKLIDYLKELQ